MQIREFGNRNGIHAKCCVRWNHFTVSMKPPHDPYRYAVKAYEMNQRPGKFSRVDSTSVSGTNGSFSLADCRFSKELCLVIYVGTTNFGTFLYIYCTLLARSGGEFAKFAYYFAMFVYRPVYQLSYGASSTFERWSQCPRSLRHELHSLARTLGSWVRIQLKAWMFVCAFILCLCCPVCR
jgi:hypothetical protein